MERHSCFQIVTRFADMGGIIVMSCSKHPRRFPRCFCLFFLLFRCLFKLMVCCRAEKRYRLDCSTAAGCLRAENSATRSTLVAHRIFSSAAPDLSRAQKPFHHWNVQVDVTAACASCGVSLRNANMLFPGSCGDGSCGTRERPSGLTVFRCGHAYHAACLSDHSQYRPKSCFVCLR